MANRWPRGGWWKIVAAGSIAGFLLLSAYFAVFGPRVSEAQGLGWDGQDFGPMAQDFSAAVRSGKIATYRLVRFLPSTLVGAASRILGTAPPTNPQVADYFAIANFLLICASALVWRSIGRSYGFPAWVTWLGFMFGFFSYSMLRAPYFDPVLTDYFAIFLAMLSLKYYLEGRTVMLVAATTAAAFTWPVAFLTNGPMLMMPRRPATAALHRLQSPLPQIDGTMLDRLARVAVVLVFILSTIYFAYVEMVPLPYGQEQIVYRLTPLSMGISFAYAAWVARCASFLPFTRRSILAPEGLVLFLSSMLLYFGVRSYILSLSGNDAPLNSFLMMLRSVTCEPIVRPAQFLVEHVVFWGGWVLLYLFWLKRVFQACEHLPAIYFSVGIWAIFFLLATGRYADYFLPTIIFALCCALEKREGLLAGRSLAVLITVSVCGSRFWLPMGLAGGYDKLLEFPAQWYFMQLGGWMGSGGYLFNLVQLLLVAGAFAVYGKGLLWPNGSFVTPNNRRSG
jgi:hypothetical protein